ncbi:MAG TPA: glycosyltransferase [Pyrinomonadaceae bacterium]|nr:glycosyltransferase [Pyrinomonadaceae bacterium]
MSRFAREHRVLFVEEPFFDGGGDRIEVVDADSNVFRLIPHLEANDRPANERIKPLLDEKLAELGVRNYINWFYSPMMVELAAGMKPQAVIFDAMDELSAFRGAPPELLANESRLFSQADLVFTGGQSLYEAKKDRHHSVHAFPSSVDVTHFAKAREVTEDAAEQRDIAHPRIGFVGVIDERMDTELLADIAGLKPDWQFVMIGPVVKISESDLPRKYNIHYLGMQSYDDLPTFLAGWDAAMMPFALNESTKYISPTKTPEYLAAGLGVASTPITDVVTPYGDLGLVHIARTAREFVAALETALSEDAETRNARVAEFLKENSWDKTFAAMSELIDNAIAVRNEGVPGTTKEARVQPREGNKELLLAAA